MPEQRRGRSSNSSKQSNSNGRNNGHSGGGSGNSKLSLNDAVRVVRDEFPALLGRRIESVLGAERDDDDNWQVMVQVVELARIPNSTDVLGAYAVTLDGGGELIGYQRRRRYVRSQADEDQ